MIGPFDSSLFGATPTISIGGSDSVEKPSETHLVISGLGRADRDAVKKKIETSPLCYCKVKEKALVVTSCDPQMIRHLEKDIGRCFPASISRPLERLRDSRNVYVPSREISPTEDEVFKEFKQYGEILSVRIHSTCYFVRFAKDTDALKAIIGYNEKRNHEQWCSLAYCSSDRSFYATLRRYSDKLEGRLKTAVRQPTSVSCGESTDDLQNMLHAYQPVLYPTCVVWTPLVSAVSYYLPSPILHHNHMPFGTFGYFPTGSPSGGIAIQYAAFGQLPGSAAVPVEATCENVSIASGGSEIIQNTWKSMPIHTDESFADCRLVKRGPSVP